MCVCVCVCDIQPYFLFGLVWFLCLMAFVGYLMPKLFYEKNSSGTI